MYEVCMASDKENNAMDVKILPVSETDFSDIEKLAKSFDLDWEDVSREQFLVAKKMNSIVGFGRLRRHPECAEAATIGVIHPERSKGVGTSIVNELLRMGPKEIYVTCVIPEFFSRFGFQTVKQYPSVLQKKVDFCKCYNFTDEQIFVMKFVRQETEKG